MLTEIKKKNVELNDFYNAIVEEKARYEVKYEKMKKRVKKLKSRLDIVDEHENAESLNVFVESIRDTSVKDDVVISKYLFNMNILIKLTRKIVCKILFVMTIVNIATSKKLSDSFILIDDKNSNIEN